MTSSLMRWYSGVAIVGFLVGAVVLARGDEAISGRRSEMTGDAICGPRCVQYILNHYGQHADLIELVRETQWPDFEAGASLEALSRALEKRGIHTCALRVDPQAKLSWPHPVLFHLTGHEAGGHYIVRLSPSSGTTRWGGLERLKKRPSEILAERFSGIALLTSPDPITDPATAVPYAGGRWSLRFLWSITTICGLVGGTGYLIRVFRKNRFPKVAAGAEPPGKE